MSLSQWVSTTLCAIGLTLPLSSVAQAGPIGAPYPPPGRLIDIGGWRIHLHCSGEDRPGQPTVLLEAGRGDFSVEWSLVQPQVSDFARVCSYDRAGDGWSDLGPHPRTMAQLSYELHTVLERGGERPPYLLVGHSFGAWLVRAYQLMYPSEVAGLILVESGASDPWRMMPDGSLVRSSQLSAGRPVPPIKTSGPLEETDIPAAALAQMRSGLAQASAAANDPPRNKLPAEAQRMRTWALGQLGHVAAAVNPFEYEELEWLRASWSGSEYPLSDLPLVVITRGLQDEEGPDAERLEQEHQRDQLMLVSLSRRGEQLKADRSGHHVLIDQPDRVTTAVQRVLAMIGP